MKRNWRWSLSTARWSALLALAAALGLLAAVACGSEADDSTDAGASQGSSAATTETTTTSSATTDAAPEPSVAIGHQVGMLAPDFTVDTVSGESFSLSEATAAGEPVLVYFFATW